MGKRFATLLLSAPLLLAPGCATLAVRVTRSEPDKPRYVYPAVEVYFQELLFPGPRSDRRVVDAGLDLGLCVVFLVPFVIVDLPISFATDTLFLPYDLYMVTLGGKTRYPEAERPPQREGGSH